jgi:hypothetical protein
MRRAARTDANHTEIVKALRAIGASVADTSSIGLGFPDLVVGFRNRNWLLEVKDGAKRPSARKLTALQDAFVTCWRGQWACVTSAQEAIDVVTMEQPQRELVGEVVHG